MAVFTAIAAAIVSAIGITGTAATIFTAIGATVLSVGVSSLVLKNKLKGQSGGVGGGRVQLPPATDNKIPVIYGSAFVGGPVVDAKISSDLKTMWYVVALAEHTDTTAGSGYTYDLSNIYYDGKRVQFGANGVVTGLINNTPSQTEIDTKVNGKIFIYLFTNGSNSGVNTGGQAAYNIIPGWTINDAMTNCAFAIVRVSYDQKAGTTSLGGLMCKITNSLDKPGSVIKDYLINTRYGCAVPLSRIDTASLTALDTYSDEAIVYGPNPGDTQARYRINGPVQTGDNCLNNLNYLADSCDSWLQYSELSAKWSVVINKPYVGSITNLFLIDSSNLVGGVSISPINLNETYNQLEVAYPNQYIKDQTDYQVIELDDYAAGIMSPNEAVNKLNVDFPYVNNSVQALYLGVRKLLQSREDLTVGFKTDYSGIQIDAGDVIRIKHNDYGWDLLNGGEGKLFRVASVAEEKYSDGSLGVTISAFEYNGTIYDDRALLNFQPDPNTGLTDPNIISDPGTPNVAINPDASGIVSSFNVETWVPTTGSVLYMDFNYGNTSNTEQHILYRTITSAAGIKFTNTVTPNNYVYLSVDINDLPAGNYYFSTVARNDFGGANSNSSTLFFWPGAGINEANIIDANGVFSSGNILTSNNAIANLSVGANVFFLSGTGQLANNTFITVVNSTTPTANFEVSPTPVVALANATIQVIIGGINGNAIVPNTLPGNRVTPNTLSGNTLIGNTVNGNVLINGTVNGNVLINGTVNGNVIIANTLHGNTIIANTVSGNTIIANTLSGNTIIANTLNGNTITANTVNGNTIIANTLNGNTILANTVNGNAITANTLNGNTIIANTINGNTFIANTLNGNSIIANTLNGNTILANTVNGNVIIANTVDGGVIIGNTILGNKLVANTITANQIAANAITAGKIDANAVTANTIAANAVTAGTVAANAITAGTIAANAITAGTIAANAITAGTIAANAVTANTIAANAVTANTIAANSITSDKIAANSITSVMIQANTVTTEQLVIGSVTQARSSIQEAQVQPMPFTNIGNAWPDNTRVIVPAGGVTIIPTTDPESSANTEYQEGSRIQVGFTVKLFANTTSNNHFYNLVELWKSGASEQFDKGLNTVRRSYEDNTYGRTQTIHAYGFGELDLYSNDQGQTWASFSSVAAGNAIMTGAMNYATGGNLANLQTFNVGPLQDVDNNGSTFCAGQRAGNTGSGSKLDLDENLPILSSTNLKLDMNGLEYCPGTGIDAGVGANREILGVADNGTIFWSPTGSFTTTAQTTEGVSGLYKNLNGIFTNPANGTSYTAIAVGQTGTILRSGRTLNTSGTWSAKTTQIIGNTPLLTDLYGVGGDNTTQSATSKWVAVGQYGMIQVSTDDGDQWTQVESPVLTDLNAVRYGNNVWVAVGDGGVILKNSGNIELANDWIQIDTSNINWANGTNYGSIEDRDLRTIDFSETYNKFFIGGVGMIIRAEANTTIVPEVSYQVTAAEVYDLTRLTFFGSWANVAKQTLPPEEQRVVNNQVFSYSIIDTDYVQGQETTYYLVVGNMAGATVYVGQAYLNVQEIKR